MAVLETLILPAVLPAAIDALKNLFGGISRRIGGLSVEDQLKLQAADVERLKALASLDTPAGVPSQWVVDLRSSFRYLGAGISILGGLGVIWYIPGAQEIGLQLISAPYAFIFGERLYLGLKGTK